MRRLSFILFLLVSVLWFLVSLSNAQEEKITITTYYPSPYGSYNELRSTRMAIGKDWYSGANVCWEDDLYCTGSSKIPADSWDPDTDLVVQGNVGIGTTGPAEKLEIGGTGDIRMNRPGGIEWTGDNEKIYASDGTDGQAGSLVFKGGGSVRMVINPTSGNVGIGTTNPPSTLSLFNVDPASNGSLAIFTENRSTTRPHPGLAIWNSYNGSYLNQPAIWFGAGNNGVSPIDPYSTSGNIWEMSAQVAGGFFYEIASIVAGTRTPRVHISSNGNVGIGTTSPNSEKGSGGYLDAKDVYLRDTGKWASESGGGFGTLGTETVTLNAVSAPVSTDGFLTINFVATSMSSSSGSVTLYADSSNPPTTVAAKQYAYYIDGPYGSMTVPLKSGWRWKFSQTAGAPSNVVTATYRWIPLGQ